jgi:hypothetical protein
MNRSLTNALGTLCIAALAGFGLIGPTQAQDLRGGPGGWGIELYNGPNYSGDRRFFSSEVSNLDRAGFNDSAISARVRGGSWQLCLDSNFEGRCVIVTRDEPDLNRLGVGFRVSSIRPVNEGAGYGGGFGGGGSGWSGGRGAEIILWERDGFGGRSVRFRDAIPNLSSQGFNDAARSIRTRGRWIVCLDANYEGRCRTIEGDLSELNGIGMASRISSIRPADGDGLDPGYGGGGYGPGYGSDMLDMSGATQGQNSVFFPRPTVGGQPAPACVGRDCGRTAADTYCRRAGFGQAGYFAVDRGRRGEVLTDLLCVR